MRLSCQHLTLDVEKERRLCRQWCRGADPLSDTATVGIQGCAHIPINLRAQTKEPGSSLNLKLNMKKQDLSHWERSMPCFQLLQVN